MKRIKQVLLMAVAALVLVLVLPDNAQAAASVKLSKQSLTIYVGGKTTLDMTGSAKKVKWSSSKKSVATVSQKGVVTAKKSGKTVITVKSGSKKATCKVTVKKQLTAKKAVSQMNRQLKKATYYSADVYMGSLKTDNLVMHVGANEKKGLIYMEAPILGLEKCYKTPHRTYWYDSSTAKWYYVSSSSSDSSETYVADDLSITGDMKYTSLGNKTFNGKKCLALSVPMEDSGTVIYYLDLADYSLAGVSSGSGSEKTIMTLDMKTKVSIPSSVTKNATYKEMSL